jgi:hypothetical protein
MCDNYADDFGTDDEPSGEEDGALDASLLLDDDDEDVPPTDPIDKAIWKLAKNIDKSTGKALTHHSRDELDLVAGIHVWTTVRTALAKTFPGWPDAPSPSYEHFRSSVSLEVRRIKACQCEATAAIQDFLKKNPYIASDMDTFLKDAGPLSVVRTKALAKYYMFILKVMAFGVKYVSAEKSIKYLVELGPVIKRGGQIFDTKTLYDKKRATSVAGSTTQSTNPAKKSRCIWVMATDGGDGFKFYSHFGKMGRFHHSSFTAGSAVMAAGEWFVENGECTLINACSGHYKPQPWRFKRAFDELKRTGVITAKTEIQVWDRRKPDATGEHRAPALEFMNGFDVNLRSYQLYPG